MDLDLASVVRVNGRIPRRAVLLPDGGLGERASHPASVEVEILSRVCELARQQSGAAWYPRQTAALLDVALRVNSPGAWAAVRDDLVTGDLDADVAVSVLSMSPNPSHLVTCLVNARESAHVLHVASLLSRVLDALPEEARSEVGRALGCQLRCLMDALADHSALLTRDVMHAMLGGFGRIVARTVQPDGRMAELVAHALSRRRDDLLRLFLYVSAGPLVDHRPSLVADLVSRAQVAPPLQRFPLVTLLTRVFRERPEHLAGREEAVCGLVRDVLDETGDSRTVLAAARLAMTAGGCGNSSLAAALRRCGGALVERGGGHVSDDDL